MKKVRIGIIGAGYISQICHLPFLKKNKYCDLIAIIEKNKNLLNKVADKYNIKNRLENYQQVPKTNLNLDVVFICVNKFLASTITSFFIKNRIAVFSEKPVAINYYLAKKLAMLSKKNKTPLIVGYMKRHDYGTKIIKEIILKKKFGKLKNIHYETFMGNSFPKSYRYIKYDRQFVKVNLSKIVNNSINSKKRKTYINFLNTHSHALNLIRYYTGDKKKIRLINKDFKKKKISMKCQNLDISLFYKFTQRGKWNEKIFLDFENARVTQVFPAPQLRNKSSTVKILNKGNNKKFSKNLWSFKSQADYNIRYFFNKKNCCTIDKCLDDLKLVEEIFS